MPLSSSGTRLTHPREGAFPAEGPVNTVDFGWMLRALSRQSGSSVICVAGLFAVVMTLTGCGNSGSPSAQGPAAHSKGSKHLVETPAEGKIGLVTPPPPLPPGERADPDSMNMGGSDVVWTIIPIGGGRYTLRIQNTSRIGFINSVDWRPPAGDTIEAVQNTTAGSCTVVSGRVSCNGLHLKPPKCLCRPGGTATVTFRMHAADPKLGFVHSALQILDMTPVPYVIPSEPGSSNQT